MTCPDWIIYALVGAGVTGVGVGLAVKHFFGAFKVKDNCPKPGNPSSGQQPPAPCIHHYGLVADIKHTRGDLSRVEEKLDKHVEKLFEKIDDMSKNCYMRTSGIMQAINGDDDE